MNATMTTIVQWQNCSYDKNPFKLRKELKKTLLWTQSGWVFWAPDMISTDSKKFYFDPLDLLQVLLTPFCYTTLYVLYVANWSASC